MGRGDRRRRWVRSTLDEANRYVALAQPRKTSSDALRAPPSPEGKASRLTRYSSCHVPTRGFSRWRNDVRRIVASLTAKLASPAEAGKAARETRAFPRSDAKATSCFPKRRFHGDRSESFGGLPSPNHPHLPPRPAAPDRYGDLRPSMASSPVIPGFRH